MSHVRELNPEVDFDPLQIGVKLRLPHAAVQKLAERQAEVETPVRLASSTAPVEAAAREPAAPAEKSVETENPRTHKVAAGESLWAIARANDTTVEALQAANDLEGSTIRPGMELKLPGSEAENVQDAPKVAEHVVRGGETLWGIARKYGSSVEAIQQANALGSRPIQPGQKLSIPL